MSGRKSSIVCFASVCVAATPGLVHAQAFNSNNAAGAPAPIAAGANSSAGGYGASATGADSTVLGNGATDNGNAGAVAVGRNTTIGGVNSVAIGNAAAATGAWGIAEGYGASAGANGVIGAQQNGGIAIGANAVAGTDTGGSTLAIGNRATATAAFGDSVAIGTDTLANAVDSIAVGAQTTASAQNTIAIGNNFTSDAGLNSVVVGVASTASAAASNAVVLGNNSAASAAGVTVLGANASATQVGGVAIGNGSVAGRAGLGGAAEAFSGTAVASTNGAVSVGTVGEERQIINVAGGTQATDAVNVRQLQTVGNDLAGSLGGGAAFDPTTGLYTAPAYSVANIGTGGTVGTPAMVNNVGAAVNGLDTDVTNLATAVNGGGIKYFHANSALADSIALVPNSVAIGPGTIASNNGDFAAGINTVAGIAGGGNTNDTAVGAGATATGGNALALGAGAMATGNANSIAIGANANAAGNQALAIGSNANAGNYVSSLALGSNATVAGNGSTAIGGNSAASGIKALALGDAAQALANSAVAIGRNTTANTVGDIAIGAAATSTGVAGVGSAVSIGPSSTASGVGAVAIGSPSTASGTGAVALGANNNAIGMGAVAIGNGANADASGASTDVGAVALGNGATATSPDDVALGSGSTTTATVATAGGTIGGVATTFAGATPSAALSVGGRQIQDVAAGRLSATSTDGVNGSQLFATNNQLGTTMGAVTSVVGGSFDPATGAYTAPAYVVGGQTYNNVGAALTAGNNLSVQYTPNATGGPTNAVDLTKGGTLAPVSVTGLANATTPSGAVTLGQTPVQYSTAGAPTTADPAVPSNDVTLVGANAGAPVALHDVAAGTLSATSTDAVNGSQLYTTNQAVTALDNGTAGLVQQDPATRAITVGAGTDGTSVGFANDTGAARTLTGVAAGTIAPGGTQAINGGQLYGTAGSVATALGGGSGVNPDGTVSAPTYNVANGTYTNVGAALTALNNGIAMGQLGPFVANNTSGRAAPSATGADASAGGFGATASGANSTVIGGNATDTGASNATVLGGNASTTTFGGVALGDGSTATRAGLAGANEAFSGTAVASTNGAVSVGAAGAERQITNVAGGTQATDAVNVRQLTSVGTDLAGSLGGGAAFDPTTGAYTAPAYTVGGQTYGNVGAALTASNALGVQYTPNATGAATNAVDLTKGGTLAPVTLTGLANATTPSGAVTLGQTPLQYSSAAAPTTANPAVPSNDVTLVGANAGMPVALHDVAAGTLTATSTDAVNGSQLYTTNQTVAALGNGTAGLVQQNPATRAITVAAGTDGTSVGFANNAGTARTLTGVAAGTVAPGSTQAVNGGQLYGTAGSVATALGGGSVVNPDGTVSAPSYNVANGTYTNVGSALTALNNGIATGTLGAFVANNTSGRAAPSATGADAAAGGFGAVAAGANSTVIGGNATDSGATNATVLGSNASTTVAGGVALGTGSTATRAGLGGANEAFSGTSVASTNGAVAVGAPGAERQITNVAGGTQATDAVNLRQLTSVGSDLAGSLGGGAAFDPATGAYTAPTYTVGGQTYTDLGAALTAGNSLAVQYTPNAMGAATNAIDLTKGGTLAPVALTGLADGTVTAVSTDAVNGSQLYATDQAIAALGSGTAGLVQQDPTSRAISVGAATNGTIVGFANNAGAARTLTGVAAGQISAGSTQAVNGGQLYGTAGSVASALGGGSTVNADGTISTPTYSVNGSSYNNVGGAIGALDNTGVKYDVTATGARGQSITLAGADPTQPVVIHNVGPGVVRTDAANVGQVQDSQLQANAYTNQQVAGVQNQVAGIDNQISNLESNISETRDEARASAAIGLAAASLRYDDRPGKFSVAAGGGYWRGEAASAFGMGYTLPDGHLRMNATAATTGSNVGVGAGLSYTFN